MCACQHRLWLKINELGRCQRNWLITKLHWVVEAANGWLRAEFCAFHDVVDTTNVKSKLSELKICCTISNEYAERFISDKNHKDETFQLMLTRIPIEQGFKKQGLLKMGLTKRELASEWSTPCERIDICRSHSLQALFLSTGGYLVEYINPYIDACKEKRCLPSGRMEKLEMKWYLLILLLSFRFLWRTLNLNRRDMRSKMNSQKLCEWRFRRDIRVKPPTSC